MFSDEEIVVMMKSSPHNFILYRIVVAVYVDVSSGESEPRQEYDEQPEV